MWKETPVMIYNRHIWSATKGTSRPINNNNSATVNKVQRPIEPISEEFAVCKLDNITWSLVSALTRNPQINSLWTGHWCTMAKQCPTKQCLISSWLWRSFVLWNSVVQSWVHVSRVPDSKIHGANMTQVGPMLTPLTSLSGVPKLKCGPLGRFAFYQIGALITIENQRVPRAEGNPTYLAEFWTIFNS